MKKMGIACTFSRSDVEKMLSNNIKNIDVIISRRLVALGVMCIKDARLKGTYTDRTGNLRSSIGFIVYNGKSKIKISGFERVKGALGNGRKGHDEGKEFAESLGNKLSRDKVHTLIVVAGMHYAARVESTKHNVLESTRLFAKGEARRIANDIINSLTK